MRQYKCHRSRNDAAQNGMYCLLSLARASLEAGIVSQIWVEYTCALAHSISDAAYCPAGLDFRYADPERGFDRSSVKGVLARLLSVKDPAASTALEVAAGGKLFQVVVDTDAAAKALLAKGQLRARVTIIPLNKV